MPRDRWTSTPGDLVPEPPEGDRWTPTPGDLVRRHSLPEVPPPPLTWFQRLHRFLSQFFGA